MQVQQQAGLLGHTTKLEAPLAALTATGKSKGCQCMPTLLSVVDATTDEKSR
jgi:hypothetical protein